MWCDRATAMRTINQWTFEEARQLGLKRCDNSPHDGQIAWYEEHGREETKDAVYKKASVPLMATKLDIYSSISVYRQEKLAAGSFNTSDVFAALSQVHILEHRGI